MGIDHEAATYLVIETTIYDRLTNTTVNTLCGGNAGGGAFAPAFDPEAFDGGALTPGRIFPVAPTVDLDQLPFVVYSITSSKPAICLNGPAGYVEYGVTVEAHATTMTEAANVGQAVRSALHLWTGSPVQLSVMTDANCRELAAGDYFGYVYSSDFSITVTED